MKKYIIWDWNGTLFDDVDVSFSSINQLLETYQLPKLKDVEMYRSYFEFPIAKYYEKMGFDFEKYAFCDLAKEYMSIYQPKSLACPLQKGVETALMYFQKEGFQQFILTASHRSNIEQQLHLHPIRSYFKKIYALDDVYAYSKLQLAERFKQEFELQNSKIYCVGDTLHDLEIAQSLNAKSILINQGHQNVKSWKCSNDNIHVFDSISDFISNFISNEKEE